jgi:CTP synthase
MATKFIFVTGGVVSSLGKGLAAASLAALLQARGYSVKLRKLDPYLNIDPGTMSPTQHGEVFVTEDGAETDLDLGHYERFTGVDSKKEDSTTAGKIYAKLLEKERKGDYLGGTVQVIPHVTDLIKEFILNNSADVDFMLCEIGGTVGDIEALPFFEAIRQLDYEMPNRCAFLHLTLLPYIASAGELKTKPTQHSVKELRSIGLQPNIILCRAEQEISKAHLHKIAQMCSIATDCVIAAPDCANIYQAPIVYHQNGLDNAILHFFNLDHSKEPNLDKWLAINDAINNPQQQVNIAIVGKYTDYQDSYKSLLEAVHHAAFSLKISINFIWINARQQSIINKQKNIHAILVPGGFGSDGTEGKISTIKFARLNNIPYLGICYGMQMAVIEYARNVLGIVDATSSEINKEGTPLICTMAEWQEENIVKKANSKKLGGTMRLGSYVCQIKDQSLASSIYQNSLINERHRHRYEVNIAFKSQLESAGLCFSGMSSDGMLTEIIELPNHPFFIGVQFHPELKSKPFSAHPLFVAFLQAAIKNSQQNKNV